MLKNDLKIIVRGLIKHKSYAAINILGLSLGIACTLLCLLFVFDELSYDRFHEKFDRIYRVRPYGIQGDNDFAMALIGYPVAQTLIDNYPEVLHATRMSRKRFSFVEYGEKKFNETDIVYVDTTFFDIFTIPLTRGYAKTALKEPYSVILSEETAAKYFANEDPMGKTLLFNESDTYKVTGVAKNLPDNSHFHFDFLASSETPGLPRPEIWFANRWYTYIVLPEDYPPEQLEAKFPDLVRKYVGPQLKTILGVDYDEMVETGGMYGLTLQPLKDIHLKSHLVREFEPNGNIATVYIFASTALFVFLIACINYINLATAQSTERAKEIGIRKTLGSTKTQLIRLFLFESMFLSLVSMFFAATIISLFLPTFNQITGKQMALDYFGEPLLIPGLVVVGLVIGVLSGIYPAFVLSGFTPIVTLRSQIVKGFSSLNLRKVLVVIQSALAFILVVGTLVIKDQINYMQNKDLGISIDNVVVVPRMSIIGSQREAFKNKLIQHSSIRNAAYSTSLPGRAIGQTIYQRERTAEGTSFNVEFFNVDYDFVETFDVKIESGRNFSEDHSSDNGAILINETAATMLGWDDPINKSVIQLTANPDFAPVLPIIGVIKDFHFKSLQQKIQPIFLRFGSTGNYLSLRIDPNNIPRALSYIENTWYEFAPERPFEYSFLQQDFNDLFKNEKRLSEIITYFSFLAIFIACLGLLGLSSYSSAQRKKEIGIRKTLGASVMNVTLLLNKDFSKLVFVSYIVSIPIAFLIMSRWLEDYSYRVSMSFSTFLFPVVLLFCVAFLTVSYHSIKSARANPVDTLKYE